MELTAPQWKMFSVDGEPDPIPSVSVEVREGESVLGRVVIVGGDRVFVEKALDNGWATPQVVGAVIEKMHNMCFVSRDGEEGVLT